MLSHDCIKYPVDERVQYEPCYPRQLNLLNINLFGR